MGSNNIKSSSILIYNQNLAVNSFLGRIIRCPMGTPLRMKIRGLQTLPISIVSSTGSTKIQGAVPTPEAHRIAQRESPSIQEKNCHNGDLKLRRGKINNAANISQKITTHITLRPLVNLNKIIQTPGSKFAGTHLVTIPCLFITQSDPGNIYDKCTDSNHIKQNC